MATDVEKLIVALEARTKAFENALAKANGVANQRAGAIEKRFTSLNKNVTNGFVGMGRGIVAALAGSAIARSIATLSESATRIDNALKVAGLSGKELESVYKQLTAAALANGAPIETLVKLYASAAQNQKELGVTSQDLLQFTGNVALALRVAGTDAQAASGALLQLGQALGSGTVHAEEFNSILEGAPTIAKAAALGLKEAGGSVAQLKALVVDGKVSSQDFFRAFEAGSPVLSEMAAGATQTLDQATSNLTTALTKVVLEFNNSTGASERFAGGINTAASAIADFDVSGFIDKIQQAKEEFETFVGGLGNSSIFEDINKALGVTDGNGNVINVDATKAKEETAGLEREVQLLQRRIALNTSLGFDNSEALARLDEVQQKLASVRAAAADIPATVPGYTVGDNGVKPIPPKKAEKFGPFEQFGPFLPTGGIKQVSINDHPPAKPTKGGGGGGRGSGRSRQDSFQREIEQIKERTSSITAETAAQSQLNPLVDDFGRSVEFARAKQELLNSAAKAGLTITPEMAEKIDQLAGGYANASSAAERLAATQDKVRERSEFLGDALYDSFADLVPQIETGNKALDKFLNTLIEAVAQSVLLGKGPFASAGGGGAGGLLGGLLSIFPFAKGGIAAGGKPLRTFAGGGVSRSAAIFGEAGPEAAVPLPDGRRIPVDLRAPRASARAAPPQDVNVTVRIDENGNLQAFVDRVAGDKVSAAAPNIVNAATQRVIPTVARYQTNVAGRDYRNG